MFWHPSTLNQGFVATATKTIFGELDETKEKTTTAQQQRLKLSRVGFWKMFIVYKTAGISAQKKIPSFVQTCEPALG